MVRNRSVAPDQERSGSTPSAGGVLKTGAALGIAAAAVYTVVRIAGARPAPPPLDPVLFLEDLHEEGANSGRGSLLAIQPYMVPTDYASEEHFAAKMDGYFRKARDLGWIDGRTVVALPEYLGLWLVAANEDHQVYEAATMDDAAVWLAMAHFGSMVRHSIAAPAANRFLYGLLRTKASQMAAIYHNTFSRIASRYGCTIVAGSTVLPGPHVENGRLLSGGGRLRNVSVVYNSSGHAEEMVTTKVYLVKDELAFLDAGRPEELPVYDTPAGKMGILICADAWFPDLYTELARRGVDFVVAPVYVREDFHLSREWMGYSGQEAPEDVEPTDLKRLTEGEAWLKYALAGRLPGSGIRAGVSVHLRGNLWGMGSDGATVAVTEAGQVHRSAVNGAAITCLWL